MRVVVWFIALSLCAPLFASDTPRLPGTVKRVIDGDTLEVLLTSGPIRVRLYGVDAPERNQPGGTEATRALTTLVDGKRVQIEPQNQDRYNRMVGVVYLGNRDINGAMIERGHAWAYRRYLRRSETQYCKLEQSARSRQLGVWAGQAVAPWRWRTRERSAQNVAETAATCAAALGRRKQPG